jgi:ribose transport system substrate-binding protein
VLKSYSDSAKSVIAQDCPKCKLTSLNSSLAKIESGAVISAIVSALQKDRSIKYVLASNGPFINGLEAAMKAAGITGVKIAGGSPSITNEQNLLNGTEAAWTGQNYAYNGWQVVDSAARHLEGMPISPDAGGAPQQLLTKDNVGTPSDQMNEPANYPDQFKALWKVG